MKSRILMGLLCGASLQWSTVVLAQDAQPKPYPINEPNQLSGWLEKHFSDMMFFCLGGKSIKLKKGWSTETVSNVPSIIARDLKLNEQPKYKSFADATLTRLFGYVYQKTDKESGGIKQLQNRYLEDNYANTADQYAEDGLKLITYEANCSSSLNAAAEVNAGYQLAPATLEAAARSSLSRNFDQTVSLTMGIFVSPLYRDWQGAGNTRVPVDQFRAAMLLWEWYRRNGLSEGKLLTSIEGWSLYRHSSQGSSNRIEGRASVGVSLPVLTTATKVETALEAGREIRSRDYYFVMVDKDGGTQVHFENLPTIAAVVDRIKTTAQTRFVPADGNLSYSNVPRPFSEVVEQLPRTFCTQSYQIKQPASGSVALISANHDSVKNQCQFSFTYIPASGASGIQDLNFDLTWNQADLKAGVTAFTLPFRATFLNSDKPKLQLESNFPVPWSSAPNPAVPTGNIMSWKTNVRLADDGKLTDISQIGLDNLSIESCSSSSKLGDFRINGTLLPRTNDRSVLLQIDVNADYSTTVSSSWRMQTCEISGNIVYEIEGSRIERPIGAKVQLTVPIDLVTPDQVIRRLESSAR